MRRVRKLKKPVDSNIDISESAPETAETQQARQRRNRANKLQKEAELLQQLQAEAAALDQENARRPCPVPKPRGALGRLLGFEDDTDVVKPGNGNR